MTEGASGTLRKVEIATAAVTTLAGTAGVGGGVVDGTGAAARFSYPTGVATGAGGYIYVTDGNGGTIRQVSASGQTVTIAGSAGPTSGDADGTGAGAHLSIPRALVSDGMHTLFVADVATAPMRRVDTTTASVTTLSLSFLGGDGGANANFISPTGLALDGTKTLFVADLNTVREVDIQAGTVTTLAGSTSGLSKDGIGPAAVFLQIGGIVNDSSGTLFVTIATLIRQVNTTTGQVTSVAGFPTGGSVDDVGLSARFNNPTGLALDDAGNLFIADTGNATIRKMVVASGSVTTVAGTAGTMGSADGTGANALFAGPTALALDGAGNLFIGDRRNSTIRKLVLATGAVTTIAGVPGGPG